MVLGCLDKSWDAVCFQQTRRNAQHISESGVLIKRSFTCRQSLGRLWVDVGAKYYNIPVIHELQGYSMGKEEDSKER